ncbi:MAG: hypothetical protein AB8B59_18660 [Maribacter sp.]
MNRIDFYKVYIPALELAFQNDDVNYGFHVKGPDHFIESNLVNQIDQFITDNEDTFLENVAYYFDAKSHSFSSFEWVPIEFFKSNLVSEMQKIKKTIQI